MDTRRIKQGRKTYRKFEKDKRKRQKRISSYDLSTRTNDWFINIGACYKTI